MFFDDLDFKGNAAAELGQGRYPKETHKRTKENSFSSVGLVQRLAKTVRP
jgi:hypothetical protein